MRYRTLADKKVSAIGLGEMPMSIEGRPDEKQAIETIHAALDAGVNFIDTADAYSLGGADTGHGERLVAKALSLWSGDKDEVLVATKGGHYRPGDGSWDVNSRPEYLRAAVEASLRRLNVESIGLYQHHRPDPSIAYEDSIGLIKEFLDAGKIQRAGISNANIDQIKTAMAILGPGNLASVQNQFSLVFRSSENELQFCTQNNIVFIPWSPLGGIGRAKNLVNNYPAILEIAGNHGVSPQQVVLAWMLSLGENVIPIPGASRPESILDSAQSTELVLTADELKQIG